MLKNINLVLLLVAFMAFTSCDDEFLETSPTDAISSTDAFATVENMGLIINGLHRGLYSQSQTILPGGNTSRAGEHFWVPMGDNLAGTLIHSANANNLGWRTNAQWNDHTLETSLTNEILWYHRYNIIASANAIINKGTDGSLPLDARLREIIGQAYTYRAYAYLSLVQHYAKGYLIGDPSTDPGVPILFESEAPYESAPRSSVQQVYDQAMDDIDVAIDYFDGATQRPTGSAAGKSQLNVDVAYGIKARIALNSGQWRIAADAAIQARANYPIMDESDWLSGFNTNLLPEVIWGSNVISTETTFFRSYFYLICNTFNGSQNRNNTKIADRRLIDAVPDTDYRKKAFIIDAPNTNSSASNNEGGFGNDPNYTDEAVFNARVTEIKDEYGITDGHNLHPYMHVKMLQQSPGSIDPDDIIYMRSSEMYLIEAEAEAMLDNVTPAQEALRPLGEARDSAYDVSIYNTRFTLMEHIKFQRDIELWGEGFGYTNKIRWDEGIDHSANGGSGASEVLYQAAFFQERPSVNNDWIFKIPQREIDANPNIGPGDQN
jgi:hypothetical protein